MVEYFFDDDPGVGSATQITVGPSQTINVMEVLNASTLPTGFHILFVRAQTDGHVQVSLDGGDYSAPFVTATQTRWGLAEPRLVFVDESGGLVADIDSLEYFFDVDPGYGNATPINITSPATVINVPEVLEASSLTLGFHTLFLRARAEGGEWGLAESRLIFVDESGAATVEIDTLEYFFDIDPGYGSATPVSATPGNVVNLLDSIPTDTLSPGFHTLFMRPRSSGGEWGMAESRLVFVQDGSVGQAVLVDQIEYFYNDDPGYGNGAAIDVTPGNVINLMDSLKADTLSTGFHNLFLRARGVGGKWGQAERRLVYVDQSGSLITNITELEWFIDTDPGYGQATTIPIAGDVTEHIQELAIATGALSHGTHVLGVRVKDANGQWGLTEFHSFFSYSEGRELDSASLRVMYNKLDGANWTNQANWLTGAIDTWFGVTVVNDRVDSIQLASNGLDGVIPFQAGYFDYVKKMDLSDNNLKDTIPQTFTGLDSLEELYLNANHLNEIPNLAGLSDLNTLALDSNLFDFGDLEQHNSIANFTYSNQKIFGDSLRDSTAVITAPLDVMLAIPVEGIANEYQWYLNGEAIGSADLPVYQILAFTPSDTGNYTLEVTNTLITDLTLTSNNYHFRLSDFDEDSLALVSLYQATGGTDWSTSTNWLSGDLTNWSGVTLTSGRVTSLDLSSNDLGGQIPPDFHYADALTDINFADNQIGGAIPETFNKMPNLATLDVSDNDLVDLPDLTSTALLNADVSGNRLDFGDLETNLNIDNFVYSPQDTLTAPKDTVVESNTNVVLGFNIGSAPNDLYQWYLDGSPIAGANLATIQLDNVDFDDEGLYHLQITNGIVPGLTLTTGTLEALIASLERDSTALRNIYDANGGENWTPAVNWTSSPVLDWDRVSFVNQRVEGVDLNGLGVSGDLSREIRVITGLNQLLLDNNEITGIPNLSQMPNLDSLVVTNNFLEYDDLEPNIFVDTILFDPQKPIPADDSVAVHQGLPYTFDVLLAGNNNTYQWYKGSSAIDGATGETFTIDSATFDDMGFYHKKAKSSIISQVDPDFEIRTADQELVVLADIDVTPIFQKNGSSVVLDVGEAFLFGYRRDQPEFGPYDTLKRVDIATPGFTFENVILDDYLIFIRSDETDSIIPTYYRNTIDWAEADTLTVEQDVAVNVDIQRIPDPTTGEGDVALLVESEFADETSGRIESRRRVKKAGCSLRRRTTGGGGRPAEDEFVLIAYRETDDNGEVDFGELPDGYYRLNVQYPGIPMDPNSFIEFEIDAAGGGVSSYRLTATVTEGGIIVENILGLKAAYFKDLNVYPVPAEDEVTIAYKRLRSHDVFVRLVDLNGKTIHNQILPKGLNQKLSLDVSKIEGGVYLLYFYDRDLGSKNVAQFKVIVNR